MGVSMSLETLEILLKLDMSSFPVSQGGGRGGEMVHHQFDPMNCLHMLAI